MKIPARGLKVKALVAALCLCALAFAQAGAAASGQKVGPKMKHDVERLRRSVAEAFGEHFELVRDELGEGAGGGLFWLVHARAKRGGAFTAKHRYKETPGKDAPRYEHVEHEITLDVYEEGCPRRPQHRYFTDACVGDTVILPFILNDYTGHTFGLAVRGPRPLGKDADDDWRETAQWVERSGGMNTDPSENPAADCLKYVGRWVTHAAYRGGGYSIGYYAVFEAVKPGSFNLSLAASAPESFQPERGRVNTIPVIVVERGTPVTLMAQGEHVTYQSAESTGGTSNNFTTTPMILQPGDRVSLYYHGASVAEWESREQVERRLAAARRDVRPVIGRLPFYVDPEHGFNKWIVNYLPVRNPGP